MYAVIEQGGKQYKVAEGDRLHIELTQVAPDAKKIELSNVLFISDGEKIKIGTPNLAGAKVVASFKTTAEEAVVKGKKLYPMNLRRRKNSKRRIGHRQKYLEVVVDKIQLSARRSRAKKVEAEAEAESES
ncbi:MAG: 50S ribosomal protein L21 [Planctomycetota bacterium]|jgi:large subunit ribosomal protein L21